MRVLNLYTTLGCHLCEQAEQMLRKQQAEKPVVVELVDISESEDLMRAYAERIPVLKWSDTEMELGWPFSEHELRMFLGAE